MNPMYELLRVIHGSKGGDYEGPLHGIKSLCDIQFYGTSRIDGGLVVVLYKLCCQ